MARDFLVEQKAYPQSIANLHYNPEFGIRGLHYDEFTGFLMKLDQFGFVQPGSVYQGHRAVGEEEVTERYRGFRLSRKYISGMHLMPDLFSVPIATLLSDLTQYFSDNNINRHGTYLYQDVLGATQYVHNSGILHDKIIDNPPHFIENENTKTFESLLRLRDAGKHVFLLTNSDFGFVNSGMTHMFAKQVREQNLPSWCDLFNVVITHAKKPLWFESKLPFRRIDKETGKMTFETVTKFESGGVYTEGCVNEFHRLTKLSEQR